MSLSDHVQRHAARQAAAPASPLTPADVARLTRWRAVYVLGGVYGVAVARRLLFLRWLREQGQFEETAASPYRVP